MLYIWKSKQINPYYHINSMAVQQNNCWDLHVNPPSVRNTSVCQKYHHSGSVTERQRINHISCHSKAIFSVYKHSVTYITIIVTLCNDLLLPLWQTILLCGCWYILALHAWSSDCIVQKVSCTIIRMSIPFENTVKHMHTITTLFAVGWLLLQYVNMEVLISFPSWIHMTMSLL